MFDPQDRVIIDKEVVARLSDNHWVMWEGRSDTTGVVYLTITSPDEEQIYVYGLRGPMFAGDETYYVGSRIL